MDQEIRQSELIAIAQENGYSISETQLARWHRYGLLPSPRQKSLGRGRGTTSLYPFSTKAQLLALLEIHERERRLAHVGWQLWWRGFVVNRQIIDTLSRRTIGNFAQLRALFSNQTTASLSPSAMDFLDNLPGIRLPQPWTAMRQNVPQEYFEGIVEMMMSIIAGQFSGAPLDPKTGTSAPVFYMMDRAMGLERARTDKIGKFGPWLASFAEGRESSLHTVASLMDPVLWRDSWDAASLARLEKTRDQVRRVSNFVIEIAPELEKVFGQGAFGLGWLAKALAFSNEKPDYQILSVIFCVVLSTAPATKSGYDAYEQLANQWNSQCKWALRAAKLLQERFPEHAALLDPFNSLKVGDDPIESQLLQDRLTQFIAAHADEIDEMLKHVSRSDVVRNDESN